MNIRSRAEKAAEHLINKVQTNDLNTVVNYLKINVSKEKFPNKISGVFYKIDEKFFIGVNEDHPEQRQRFTIAHEIGHYCLHEASIFHYDHEKKEGELFFRAEDKISLDEVEANHFAAALLMPRKLIDEDFLKNQSITSLASKYNVSEEAMRYRLINLGLM